MVIHELYYVSIIIKLITLLHVAVRMLLLNCQGAGISLSVTREMTFIVNSAEIENMNCPIAWSKLIHQSIKILLSYC